MARHFPRSIFCTSLDVPGNVKLPTPELWAKSARWKNFRPSTCMKMDLVLKIPDLVMEMIGYLFENGRSGIDNNRISD